MPPDRFVHVHKTARTAAAAVAATLLIGACSSSTSKHSSAPTIPGPTTAPSASAAPTTLAPGSTVAPPTTAGGPQRCAPSSLKGSFTLAPGGGSAGHVEGQVVLTNVGAAVCTIFGYIGMQLLGASGAPLPTNVVRVPGTEKQVTLNPGASASVLAQFSSDVPGAGDSTTGTCQPVAKSTEITPPDETQHLVVPGPDSPVCQRGTIDIQPVTSGTGG